MVNHDIFGSILPTDSTGGGGGNEPGSNVGHYRTVTQSISDGDQSWNIPLAAPITNIQQATFAFGLRLTPETGNLCASQFGFVIDTMGVRANFYVAIEDIALNSYSASRVKASPTREGLGTQIELSSATGGYTLLYSDINFDSHQVQPGVVYWFSANIVFDDLAMSNICLNGKPLLNGTHCTALTGGYGWGPGDGDNKILVSRKVFGSIPIKIDLFNVYGAVFDTPTGTDGTEFTEPMVNYNDWGTPTMEDGRIYYTSTPNMWQLNWNSTTDPMGNIGLNPGTFTGGTVDFAMGNEEMFLHPNVGEGKYRAIRIDDKLAAASRNFQMHFNTDQLPYNTQHFIIAVTELIGASDNSLHPFTGYGLATNETTNDTGSITGMVGTFMNNLNKAETYTYTTRGYKGSLNTSMATPYRQKLCQTAKTGNAYIFYYTANKVSYSFTNMASTLYFKSIHGSKLFMHMPTYGILYERRMVYYAIYSADLMLAHPEITWTDGVAMHNYFYKPDSYVIVDDLVNAIPGVQPTIVCYNAKQVRGWGSDRHSLPTYQKKITFGWVVDGTGGGTFSNNDFYSSDIISEGDFSVSV
jgi:hypothetical protein